MLHTDKPIQPPHKKGHIVKNNLIIAALTATLLFANNNAGANYTMTSSSHQLLKVGTYTVGTIWFISLLGVKYLEHHYNTVREQYKVAPKKSDKRTDLWKQMLKTDNHLSKFMATCKVTMPTFLGLGIAWLVTSRSNVP